MVEIKKHIHSQVNYNLKNIRILLSEAFNLEGLYHLYATPQFEKVSSSLPQNASQAQIIQAIIGEADRKLKFEELLTLARQSDPAKYEQYRPYFVSITVTATITIKGNDQLLNELRLRFPQESFQQKILECLNLLVQTLKITDNFQYETKQEFGMVELFTKEKAGNISFTITITGSEQHLSELNLQLSEESLRQKNLDSLELLVQEIKELDETYQPASQEPSSTKSASPPITPKKPWWKFW